MGKQVNFYLVQKDIEKIEKYLTDRHFVFVKDQILSKPDFVYEKRLFDFPNQARYITFPNLPLHYRVWEKDGTQNFRLTSGKTVAMEFNFFGKQGDFYKGRFFYETENPELNLASERFFRWFKRNFSQIPELPLFFQNPEIP